MMPRGREYFLPLRMVNALADAALLYGPAALQAVLIVRLWQLQALKRYPVLAAYLGFSLLRGVALLYYLRSGLRLPGKGYTLLYLSTRPVLWIFYFLIIFELYSLMLEQFQGIRRLGRLILLVALAAVTVVSCVLVLLDDRAGFHPYPFLSYLALQERSVFFCLSVLAFLLVLFVSHYQIPTRRNIWVLFVCFSAYFISETVIFALRRHFGAEFNRGLNLANACFYALALLGSALFVSASGEKETQPMSIPWGSERREVEASLLAQLQSFDTVLTKVLRS